MSLLGWQSMMALFLASFTGPGQVSPDLANNALSLYLARPFSRVEYVLGKMTILMVLMSLMTWVPGLLLFGLQGYLEGWQWMKGNARIASGIFFGAWVWILLLALLALALSAWVKWKPAAGALMFGVFFVAGGFGATINAVLRTKWGHLFNISELIGSIWVQLFEGQTHTTNGAVFFRVIEGEEIALWCCWASLAAPRWSDESGPDYLQQRLALLWRSPRHQQSQPQHSARHHQPGRPQRLRQDHPHEHDDRSDPP